MSVLVKVEKLNLVMQTKKKKIFLDSVFLSVDFNETVFCFFFKYDIKSWNNASVGLMKHLWFSKQHFYIIVTYLS